MARKQAGMENVSVWLPTRVIEATEKIVRRRRLQAEYEGQHVTEHEVSRSTVWREAIQYGLPIVEQHDAERFREDDL